MEAWKTGPVKVSLVRDDDEPGIGLVNLPVVVVIDGVVVVVEGMVVEEVEERGFGGGLTNLEGVRGIIFESPNADSEPPLGAVMTSIPLQTQPSSVEKRACGEGLGRG